LGFVVSVGFVETGGVVGVGRVLVTLSVFGLLEVDATDFLDRHPTVIIKKEKIKGSR
jgi:hypothetical protein